MNKRNVTRRTWIASMLIIASLALVSCGGGGGGGTSTSPSYFPLTQGSTWRLQGSVTESTGAASKLVWRAAKRVGMRSGIYRAGATSNYSYTMKIAGTKEVNGVTATILSEQPERGGTADETYLLQDSGGISYLGNNNLNDRITPQLVPYQIMQFPLEAGSSFVQVKKTGLDTGEDYDFDGRNDLEDVYGTVTVVGFETVTVPAGTFQNCARIETKTTINITLSTDNSILEINKTHMHWYANGIGPVKQITSTQVQHGTWSYSESGIEELTDYLVNGQSADTTAPLNTIQTNFINSGASATNSTSVTLSLSATDIIAVKAYYISENSITPLVSENAWTEISSASSFAADVPYTLSNGDGTKTVYIWFKDAVGHISNPKSDTIILDTAVPDTTITGKPANPSNQTTVSLSFTSSELNSTFQCQIDNGGFTPCTGSAFYTGLTSGSHIFEVKATDAVGNTDLTAASYSWTIDLTPPAIISVTPSDGASGFKENPTISVTFSEAIDNAAFIVKDMTNIEMRGTYNYSGTTITFTPNDKLVSGTYTIAATTRVSDLAGNFLTTEYTSSFVMESTPFSNYDVTLEGCGPSAVTIGDVNGDGRNDLVGVGFNNILCIYIQNSDGTLPAKPITGSATGRLSTVAVGDVNNDGRNDVIVGNAGQNIEVFIQNDSGGLNSEVTYSTVNSRNIKIKDLNNDGLMDVVGIGYGTNSVDIFLQNNSGTLNSPITYSVTNTGSGIVNVADMTNDGLPDIIVMSMFTSDIGILTQKSDGTFNLPIYYNLENNIVGGDVGDVNGDGLNDIVVTNGRNQPDSKIYVFLQNNLGTLDPSTSYYSYSLPYAIEIADVNNDSKQDVIVGHYAYGVMGVYMQGTDGNLTPEERYSARLISDNPQGIAVGDLNGDNLNDVVTCGDPDIHYNLTPNSISLAPKVMTSTDYNLSNKENNTGCFIATAAYGSYLDPHVMILREFRDNYLLTSAAGRTFVSLYYNASPPVAELIREHKPLRVAARIALTPIVYGIEYPNGTMLLVSCIVIGIVGYRRKILRGSLEKWDTDQ